MNKKYSTLEIIDLVINSEHLSGHRTSDPELNRLLTSFTASPNNRKFSKDIHVSLPSDLPASHYEDIYKRRLKLTADKPDSQQLKAEITNLLDFLSENSNTRIQTVTFNLPKKSYTVFLGCTDSKLIVISVFVGKHMPEKFLRSEQNN